MKPSRSRWLKVSIWRWSTLTGRVSAACPAAAPVGRSRTAARNQGLMGVSIRAGASSPQRLVHQPPELLLNGIGLKREELGEDHPDQAIVGIDPEERVGVAPPAGAARRPQRRVGGSDHDAEAQAEARPIEGGPADTDRD